MKKKIFAIIMVILIMIVSCSCSQMPFNGDIEFHDISLTIPERFVRDSTQSTEDLWLFEHDWYSEVIILSRKDAAADVQTFLADYVEYMQGNGAESEIVPFLSGYGVFSAYYKEDVFCQEILFAHNHSFYAIALRGGTQSDFQEITDTIQFVGVANDGKSDGSQHQGTVLGCFIKEENGTYSYEITDYHGVVLDARDHLTRSPKKHTVSSHVIGISMQAGTGLATNYARFYDLENSRASETFYYVLDAKDGFVVYANHADGEPVVVVQDIFDKEQYCMEYQLENVSPVAADFVVDGYFDADGNICITYLSGEDYTETSYTIELLPKDKVA